MLRDLKDTLVVTSSHAGAQVIPFIKVWGMLPAAFLSSFAFAKLHAKWGRNGALRFFTCLLLVFYLIFAFIIYPTQDRWRLKLPWLDHLPSGFSGFTTMIRFWSFSLFYIFAELWSMMILSVLFWGGVNDVTSKDESKSFYPLCILVGNLSGFLSGQFSHLLCTKLPSWQITLQVIVAISLVAGGAIVLIAGRIFPNSELKKETKGSLKTNISTILKSPQLISIALLVIGFALTHNLIEVVWKGVIKHHHPTPETYNAYINKVTSIVGLSSTLMFFGMRWLFKHFHWSKIAFLTPLVLLIKSSLFFGLKFSENLIPAELILIMGSVHYVMATTAKYTIFDSTKEMAFLGICESKRLRAKSVIDSVGSRIGKSGASAFHQGVIIIAGATASYVPIVGIIAILTVATMLRAARRLGQSEGLLISVD